MMLVGVYHCHAEVRYHLDESVYLSPFAGDYHFSKSDKIGNLSTQILWQNSQLAITPKERKALSDVRMKAFLKSVLIPGWGQISTGRTVRGYIFLGAEVALIAGYIGFQARETWLKDDYITYANQHANLIGDHPHQFYVDIGNWLDQRSYNEQRNLERDFEALYPRPTDTWSWDSDDNRAHFKSMRIASDISGRLAIFMVGGMIINHLASAIDATHLQDRVGQISIEPTSNADGLMVGIRFRN